MYRDSQYLINCIFGSKFNYTEEIEMNILKKVSSDLLNCITVTKDNFSLNTKNAQVVLYERPDLVLILEDYAIIIEHFEVDASKYTKKGSEYRKYYTNKYNKSISEKLNTKIRNDKIYAKHTEIIKSKLSFNNLIENLFRISDDHYQKIDSYHERIKNDFNLSDKKIYTSFFVECKQLLPTYVVDKDKNVKAITPVHDIRLYNYLKKRRNIDAIIIHYNTVPSYNHFVLNTLESIENRCQEDNKSLFDLNKVEVHDSSYPMKMTIMSKTNLK